MKQLFMILRNCYEEFIKSFLNKKIISSDMGVEPMTTGLKGLRSTDWANRTLLQTGIEPVTFGS